MDDSTGDSHGPHAHTGLHCLEAIEIMYQFIDGELPDDRRRDVQVHLEACLSCYEAFDFEAEFLQMISVKCREYPPPDLHTKILSVLMREGGIPPPS